MSEKQLPKCKRCDNEMEEVITDPIFRKIKFYCPFCKMMDDAEAKKYEKIYKNADKIILEEIQRIFDPKLKLMDNHKLFNQYSKITLSYNKYIKIVRREAQRIKENIKKK